MIDLGRGEGSDLHQAVYAGAMYLTESASLAVKAQIKADPGKPMSETRLITTQCSPPFLSNQCHLVCTIHRANPHTKFLPGLLAGLGGSGFILNWILQPAM